MPNVPRGTPLPCSPIPITCSAPKSPPPVESPLTAPATAHTPKPSYPMVTRSKNNIVKPNPKYVQVVTASTETPPLEPTFVKDVDTTFCPV
ncbi:unnamed protein product [Linum trigynum]|uniref:Uncharacterized protein n=1 Tax=Linum trigynum TaxID=586398 RepID=A0AAV2ERJ3_9ROSI